MTKLQCGKKHQRGRVLPSATGTACGAAPWLLMAILSSALLSGCVSVEKYEAEKTRVFNFQRLLAQEENRAGELNAQLQEADIEIASLESQKNELAVKLEALRGQVGRSSESVFSDSAPAASKDAGESDDMSFSKTSLSELGLPDLAFEDTMGQGFDAAGQNTGEPRYHTVKSGETLYRISRNHGVTIAQLKTWNNLTGDIISIGQRLIVSTP